MISPFHAPSEHFEVNQAEFWKSKWIKKDNKFKELWERAIRKEWNVRTGLRCLYLLKEYSIYKFHPDLGCF